MEHNVSVAVKKNCPVRVLQPSDVSDGAASQADSEDEDEALPAAIKPTCGRPFAASESTPNVSEKKRARAEYARESRKKSSIGLEARRRSRKGPPTPSRACRASSATTSMHTAALPSAPDSPNPSLARCVILKILTISPFQAGTVAEEPPPPPLDLPGVSAGGSSQPGAHFSRLQCGASDSMHRAGHRTATCTAHYQLPPPHHPCPPCPRPPTPPLPPLSF